MNEYQRIIQRELLKGERAECSEIERALYDAAGAADNLRLKEVLAVKDRAAAAGCRAATLHALFILAVEYATRLDRDGVDRTNVELLKLKKEMDEVDAD